MCEDLRVPLTWVYAVDAVLYIIVLLIFIFLTVRHYRKTRGSDFEEARFKGVLTSHPEYFGPKVLFAYRTIAGLFVFAVHIREMALSDPRSYRFYTVWNFIVLIVYFAVGIALSLYSIVKGHDALAQSRYWKFNASLHYLSLIHI